MYTIVIRPLYILQRDHPDKSSAHLSFSLLRMSVASLPLYTLESNPNTLYYSGWPALIAPSVLQGIFGSFSVIEMPILFVFLSVASFSSLPHSQSGMSHATSSLLSPACASACITGSNLILPSTNIELPTCSKTILCLYPQSLSLEYGK